MAVCFLARDSPSIPPAAGRTPSAFCLHASVLPAPLRQATLFLSVT